MRGNLVSATTPEGTTSYTVDAANQLVSDSDGTAYAYDDAGRLVEVVNTDGSREGYSYDQAGRLTQVVSTGIVPGGLVVDACDTATPTIIGTGGDDVIVGTSGDDVIFGLGGNDLIEGGNGNDLICGGDGDDTLVGDNGEDILSGGPGADTLDGRNGVDLLLGGDGDDTLVGDRGDDSLFGQAGVDTLDGGNGDDALNGGAGADTLAGGKGNDSLQGGPGVDSLDGGNGDDQCEPEAGRVSCELDLEGGDPTQTVISRDYTPDGLLARVSVTHPDGTIDVHDLIWDRTLPIPQILTVTTNGDTTTLTYGANRAQAIDPSGAATSYEYSVLGDTIGGPLTIAGGFDPYGQPDTQTGVVGFGYRGELHVGDTVHLRARDLHPDLARFGTEDPLAGVPGTTTVGTAYAYAGNDPVGQIDPLGLRPRDGGDFKVNANLPVPVVPSEEPRVAQWLSDRAVDVARELLFGTLAARTTGVCGDITFDVLLSVQIQGCLVDDGDRLGTLGFTVGGVGGGPPPLFGAVSSNLTYLLSNARRNEDLAGDTACVGVAAGVLVAAGVEVCFGLRPGVLLGRVDEAQFKSASTGVFTIAVSAGGSFGTPIVGRAVVGTTAVGTLWDYPFFIDRIIPRPIDILIAPMTGGR